LFTALFIVDGYYEVYVWEGWMAEDDDDARTGSGRQRWDRDRKLAMETALNYAKGLGLGKNGMMTSIFYFRRIAVEVSTIE